MAKRSKSRVVRNRPLGLVIALIFGYSPPLRRQDHRLNCKRLTEGEFDQTDGHQRGRERPPDQRPQSKFRGVAT